MLVRSFLEHQRHEDARAEARLTRREVQVIRLIAQGLPNTRIAQALAISPKTVQRHRDNLMAKLGIRDRVALTRFAIREGIVEP